MYTTPQWDLFLQTGEHSVNTMLDTNKTEEKNRTSTQTDADKAFDEIQHPFMIETLNKVGAEGKHLDVIKAAYDKPSANTLLTGEQLKGFL